jgi:hypothetical protein
MDSRLYLYFVIAAITQLIPELERLQGMDSIPQMAWSIAILKSSLAGFIAAKAFQSSPQAVVMPPQSEPPIPTIPKMP